MRARDLMTRGVVTLPEDATIGDAIEAVSTHNVRHVPVVRGDQVIGVISDRALRPIFGLMALEIGEEPASAPAMDFPAMSLVTAPVVSVAADAGVDEVIDRFLSEQVGAVLVLDTSGALEGIISYIDVLKAARGKLG